MNLGNTSSIHHAGVKANVILEKSREVIAAKLNCKPHEIYFTSGATESNNIVLKGILSQFSKGDEIIISSIEHSSVFNLISFLSEKGLIVKMVGVSRDGIVNFEELTRMITKKTKLISIIHANNEIGTTQDLIKIGRLCDERKIFFHSDGAQAFCKTHIDTKQMNLDFYTISGHKIHAPKGIGALFIKEGITLKPLFAGGTQELGLRPGTVALELASAFAFATGLYNTESLDSFSILRNNFNSELLEKLPTAIIHGGSSYCLDNIINFTIPGIQGKYLMRELDKLGIRVSLGSACHANMKTPSRILLSLGLNEDQANESIRVSFGITSELADLSALISAIVKICENKV
jgi:cysteine desulfurase